MLRRVRSVDAASGTARSSRGASYVSYVHLYVSPYVHLCVSPYVHLNVSPYVHLCVSPYAHLYVSPHVHQICTPPCAYESHMKDRVHVYALHDLYV